jgi:hypothetical protein
MSEVAEKMDKLSAYRKMKEETGLAIFQDRKRAITQTHDIIAKSMFLNMEDMKNDLNKICKDISSATSFKSGIGKKFEEGHYAEFKKSWDIYIEDYNYFLKDPNSFDRFSKYHASLSSLIDNFNEAMNAYVEKRTDLWFRYVDNASNVLNAAVMVQVGISIFTEGATLVTAGITKAAQWAMKKTAKEIGEKAVKKSLMKAIKVRIAENIAYKMMNSKAMTLGIFPASILYSMSGKQYASNEFVRQKVAESRLSGTPMFDKETRNRIMAEYDRFGSTITLEELGSSIENVTNPKGIGTAEYMKSAAVVLASYYILMGIPQISKLIKKGNVPSIGPEFVPAVK